jgi:hypothetical protein
LHIEAARGFDFSPTASMKARPHYQTIRTPIWIFRGLLAWLLIRPKAELVGFNWAGAAKVTRFVTLKNSKRSLQVATFAQAEFLQCRQVEVLGRVAAEIVEVRIERTNVTRELPARVGIELGGIESRTIGLVRVQIEPGA